MFQIMTMIFALSLKTLLKPQQKGGSSQMKNHTTHSQPLSQSYLEKQ